MKRLLLMRHAKAVPYEPGADHERPLVERGCNDAKSMGDRMRDAGIAPDLVLCSSTTRARETLDEILPSFGEGVSVYVEPRIYGASVDELLDVVHGIDESVESAMLIGHNPGMHQLAVGLAGSGDRLEELAAKYPTASVAELRFDALWALIDFRGAELTAFIAPRDVR